MQKENVKKQPWPTQKAMEQVYEMHLWGKGEKETDFYSGDGSHKKEIIAPYIKAVRSFLTSFTTPLTVCDLGCGDFNIGKELVANTRKYIAIDIVADLITHNQQVFLAPNLEFYCLDIAKDTLPPADCVFIRQVLQHLSNTEVLQIIEKLPQYKYIILTEHVPVGDFVPNKDIISGQGIRIKKQSGLNLLHSPFHLQVEKEQELVNILLEDQKGRIVTTLYQTSKV